VPQLPGHKRCPDRDGRLLSGVLPPGHGGDRR